MAGDADEPFLLVLLLIMNGFRHLVFIRRRNRFQQRLRLLAVWNRRRRTEAYFFHSQRNICRTRKVVWVLERPQFWFEHTVLNQKANNIWQAEHSCISRQMFQFVYNLVGPHLVWKDTNMQTLLLTLSLSDLLLCSGLPLEIRIGPRV